MPEGLKKAPKGAGRKFRGIHTADSEPSRWAVIEDKTEDENHMKYWSTNKIVIS